MADTTANKLLLNHSGNGGSIGLDVDGFVTAAFQVFGVFTGTVEFEASLDGAQFSQIICEDIKNGSSHTFTKSAGIFRCNVRAIKQVRVVITNYVSGSISVTASAIQA